MHAYSNMCRDNHVEIGFMGHTCPLCPEIRWRDEDPRMLREQLRVADLAFNELRRQLDEKNLKLAMIVSMIESFEKKHGKL